MTQRIGARCAMLKAERASPHFQSRCPPGLLHLPFSFNSRVCPLQLLLQRGHPADTSNPPAPHLAFNDLLPMCMTLVCQWEMPASWQQHHSAAAQYHPISPQPQHPYVQQQDPYAQPQHSHAPLQQPPQQQPLSLKGILGGAVHAASDLVKEKVVHAGAPLS